MLRSRCLSLVLFLAATLSSLGQEIKIIGPSTPVAPNDTAVLTVIGLTDEEIPRAKPTSTPSKDVQLLTNRPWSGYPYLTFRSKVPGKYVVEVTLNAWRSNLDLVLQDAKAANIQTPLLAELEALAGKFSASYPIRLGTCVVEVAGVPPFVPPDPPGPDPPTPVAGRKRVLILLERGQTTPDQARLITSLQGGVSAASKYLVSKQHLLVIYDDDHPLGQQWIPKLGNLQPPAVIVQDVSTSTVSVVSSLPPSADAVIELVKKAGG